MAENFYTILTNVGKAKLANAQALGTTVQFSSIAVGDGSGNYYDPIESQTALKNEVWRGAINQIKTDSENPNWIIVEVVIPTTTESFTVREAGIIDSEGDLIALGKYPATYKPALAEGSGKDLYIRMILEVSNASAITLKIDPAVVLSTRGYVDDSLATHNANSAAHSNLPYLKTSEVVVSPEPNKVLKLDADGKIADSAGAVPSGAVAYFSKNSPPDGWLKCNGAEISRTTYSGLFSAIGTVFGAGDGSTTFQLPDLRGEFLRGLDDGRGVDGGRALGTLQDEATAVNGLYLTLQRSKTTSMPTLNAGNNNLPFNANGDISRFDMFNGASGIKSTDSETRPRNIALLACIKY